MPPVPPVTQRLALEIAGLPTPELNADLVSLRFTESLTQTGLIEVALNNWAGAPPGYKYSEAAALRLGVQVKLTYAGVTMATGTIVSLAPHFSAGTAPTFGFTATVPRPVPGPSATLQLAYGADLIEFNPTLRTVGSAGRQTFTAAGVASGLSTLRAGARLAINGLGAHWTGNYAVKEAIHSFDPQHGYRVSFACSR